MWPFLYPSNCYIVISNTILLDEDCYGSAIAFILVYVELLIGCTLIGYQLVVHESCSCLPAKVKSEDVIRVPGEY